MVEVKKFLIYQKQLAVRQDMGATNKTTYYELPQYIQSDKPSYLGDFNGAMNTIDGAIHTNAVNIGINETAITNTNTSIGDLSTLSTTTKTSVVGAINEVNSNTNTNTSNIGTLSNLNTFDKTNLVSAINSVNMSNTYSNSNEIVVGKWYDGQTIYRKIVEFSVLNESTTDYVSVSTGLPNTYKLIKPLEISKANGYDICWFARSQINMYMTTVENILTFKFLPAQNECVGNWTMIIEYIKNEA